MKKKLVALVATLAITIVSVVPALAATPEQEVLSAIATQNKQIEEYLTYQANLAAFQASQIAKGEAERAAGIAAYNEYQARLAAFYAANLNKQAEYLAKRAELQKLINAYLAKL